MSGNNNFVGSKISLISKAGIRYEGTLVDINAVESTVALEHVISFGTENRACPQAYPPSKTLYQCIKFRGSDIADLHVYEQTPPQDPAIIEATQVAPSGTIPTGITAPLSPGGPVGNSTLGNSFSSNTSGAGTFPIYQGNPAPTPTNSFQDLPDSLKHSTSSPAPDAPPKNEVKIEQQDEHRDENSGNYRNRGRSNNNNNNNTRRNSYRRYREGMPYTNKTLSFEADFDFAMSNAKFNKNEIEEEFNKKMSKLSVTEDNGIEPVEDVKENSDEDKDGDQCYDKNKSFFDTISCEALEKGNGQRRRPPSWHAERNLNSETFGEGVVSYQRRNYRGDYRGGRGGMNPSYNSGYINYHNGPRYNNYRGRPDHNSYYRGGYRNDGYRSNGYRHNDEGYNRGGDYRRDYSRDNGYNRENRYNNRENSYNHRENGYNQRENGYNQRDSGYNQRDRNYYRDNNNTNYSEQNNYRRDNNIQRSRNNEEGRLSYRRVDRGGLQQAQTDAM